MPTTQDQVLRDIRDANFHHGGLRCLRVLRVESDFFRDLKSEIAQLVEDNQPSDVQSKEHLTNWTRPYGQAIQYSLLNESGKFDDFTKDFNGTNHGKRFHHSDRYPTIGEFIAGFPDAINLRLNGMGPNSGLSPHEEHTVIRQGRRFGVRVRLHLPIATTPAAQVYLDGDFFHFDEGSIYYFNNGCVHSARNRGDEIRFHLVWDMPLTERTYEMLFNTDDLAAHPFLERVTGEDQSVPVVSHEDVQGFETIGPAARIHKMLGLSRLGVPHHKFQNVYNQVAYRYWLITPPTLVGDQH
jgi:hypothetical protein